MKTQRHARPFQRGYFALSIALLVSVVASAIVVSLRSKFARIDAESVLIDDREDYAIARHLENVVHDSVQRTAGQGALLNSGSTDIETEVLARLATVPMPGNSGVALAASESPYPTPPRVQFFPQSTEDFSRVPTNGALAPGDIPYGALGNLLRFGYYTTAIASLSFSFERTRNAEVETRLQVDAAAYAVPLTSQRLVIFNYPSDLGGTRPLTAPDLNYLDADNSLSGLINTQFSADGDIVDAVSAVGPDKTMRCYRHRSQVCEEIFQYLFKGSYLSSLQAYGGTTTIDISNIALALETHEGLYTEEQENTPPGEPLPPPADARFKMDIAQFEDSAIVYFHQPTDSPVEITLLDSNPSSGGPLVIALDRSSGSGTYKLRFEEVVDRPVFYVLTGTTVEFTNSFSGILGIPTGAIAGAFLMDEYSSFSADANSAQSTRIVYGSVLGHRSLLTNGFLGASNHPVPVMAFPDPNYYESLEALSPRAMIVATRSRLTPVKTQNAVVLAP